mmetsp:Transcript_60646/g.179841  ORF Transcript_60646/g.179841 Transcript_60646/m.179841 type:complete len:485 (-) Transcript_60646:119-1573(-)
MLSRLRPSVPRRKRSDPGGSGGGSVLPTHRVIPAPGGGGGKGGVKSRSSSSSSNSRPPSSRSGVSGHHSSSRRHRPGVIRAVPHGVPPGSVADEGVILPGEAACTSFLLGGAYYPGKDKRARSHLKRAHLKRTLWYRVLCSSRRRMGSSAILGTMCAIYLGGPLLNRILDLGAWLAGRGGGSRGGSPKYRAGAALEELFPDLAGMIRPAEEYGRESKWILKAAEMHRHGFDRGGEQYGGGSRYGAPNERMELLGDVDQAVSDFIHRNDERDDADEMEGGDAAGAEEVDAANGEEEGDDELADDWEEGDDEDLDVADLNKAKNVAGGNVDDGGIDDDDEEGEGGLRPDEDIEEIAQEEADDDSEGGGGEANGGEGDDDEAAAAETIKGMNLRIGVAMSQDGLTWGRVESDDPTDHRRRRGAVRSIRPQPKMDDGRGADISRRRFIAPLAPSTKNCTPAGREAVAHRITHGGDGAGNALSRQQLQQ